MFKKLVCATTLLVLICGGVFVSRSTLAVDSWTFFREGRYVLEHKQIPTHNDLSFKIVDAAFEWPQQAWLASTILYRVYKQGEAAVVVFLIGVWMCCGWVLYLWQRLLGVSKRIALLFADLGLVVYLGFWKMHPYMLATGVMLGLGYFLSKFFIQKKYLCLFIYLFLNILLANILGILVPVVMVVSVVVVFVHIVLARPKKGEVWFWVVWLGLVFVSGLLSPSGFEIYQQVRTFVAIAQQRSVYSTLAQSLLFINQNFLLEAQSGLFQVMFVGTWALTLVGVFLWFGKKFSGLRKQLSCLMPMLVLGLLALGWVRFICLSVGVVVVFSGYVFEQVLSHTKSTRNVIYLSFLCVFLLCTTVAIFVLRPKQFVFHPPVTQVKLIKEWNLPDTIFTSFDITGYASYFLPERKFLLDAQDNTFDENQAVYFYTPTMLIPKDALNKVADSLDVKTVLVSRNLFEYAGSFSNIDTWALLYFDRNGFLFVDRHAVTREFLLAHELKYVRAERNLGFDPKDVKAAIVELEGFVNTYPDNTLALGQLATMYRISGNLNGARDILARVPEEDWDFTYFTELGRTEAASGNCKRAELAFSLALKQRSEKVYSRTILDMAVLQAGCLGNKALAKHYFQRYNSFALSPDEGEKLRQLTRDFDIQLEE